MGASSSRSKFDYTIDGVDINIKESSLKYDLATIRKATNNFSASNEIGEGRSGKVYKGVLCAQEIAVTRAYPALPFEDFKNEVRLMHRLRLEHPNVVRVLGFCLKGKEKLLIHEYAPNRSLDTYLFDNIKALFGSYILISIYVYGDFEIPPNQTGPKRSYLDWGKRYKIIGDIARGLLYLHEGVQFQIIHRNLKPQNILLDGEMNAKITDFGLAMFFLPDETQDSISGAVVGTLGYIAPEYLSRGRISVKSDVFSFGISLLVIVSGQKAVSYDRPESEIFLGHYVRYHWMKGSALDWLVDPTLHNNFWEGEVRRCIHIGLLCVQENVEDRPTMSSVVGMLNDHSLTLEAPSKYSSNIATRETELEDSCAQSCNSSFSSHGVDIITSESLQFDLGTIRNATNYFSADNKLGKGLLGAVYKGELPDGQEIVVKRLSGKTFSRHEIKNEVDLLLKIQHRNLVRLLGFCLEGEKGNRQGMLIYEYVPNGSLDRYIFDNAKKSYLDWDKRYKIIGSIARGLLYAHEDSRTIKIHGNLKATNILLDDEMNPKVADFGMFNIYQTQGNSTRIGTIGYMPPEYLLEGFMSAKADVYSFGVLLLEIISGKRITSFLRPTSPYGLLGYAWNHWREGTAIELMDPSLNDSFLRDEVLRSIHIGLLCVQDKVEDRPTMRMVVRMLNNDSDIAGFPFPSKHEFYGESITHSNMTKRETELDQCNTSSEGYDIRANESLQFDLATIKNATNNFSASNKIGEGGFGIVYKGMLCAQEIAVTRASSNSTLGFEGFKNELMFMHRLRLQHRNLVRVLGFCLEGEEKLLIHEYVPNSSLDSYLFDNIKRSYLDWGKRYKIIGDIARGLLYLHEGSRFKIIHRNLKPQNILLDGAMNAKIADFGLAKLFVHHQTQGRTSKIAGTFGYMAPEYVRDGLISVKSDVFSFGILLLEIISGQRTNGFHHFHPDLEYTHLEYVWKHWMKGSALDQLVDPTLHDNCWEDEVMKCIHIGLLCVQQNVEDRPTMSSVVGMLNDHSPPTLEAPLQPAFCAENSSNNATRETELEDSRAQSCNSSPFNPRL